MVYQMQAKFFHGLDGVLSGQRVHRVLHGVGGQNLAVVALGVSGLEVAFKTDRHRQFFDIVAAFLASDAQQPDA